MINGAMPQTETQLVLYLPRIAHKKVNLVEKKISHLTVLFNYTSG